MFDSQLRALIAEGGEEVVSPLDGEEGITMLADLDAGATGTMSSAMIPELIGKVVAAHREGIRDAAVAGYAHTANHQSREPAVRVSGRKGGV